MKRIKFLSLLLTFVMLLTVQIPVCAVSPSATLTAEQDEITEQDGVLEIRLDATEAILGGSFNLVYDSSVLEFSFTSSDSYNCQTNSSYAPNRIRVSFASTQGMTTGVLLRFYFRPLVSDSCTTAFSFEEVSLYNAAGKSVETTTVGAVCDVKVLKPLTDVQLSTQALTMGVGEEVQMSYHLTPTDATVEEVSWSSHNTSVATVDPNGVVKAVRAGSVYMECTVRDCYFNYFTKGFTATVYQKPNITVAGGYVAPGEQITLAVRLDTVGSVYTSGSLNMTYDPTLLSMQSAVIGGMLKGCMTTVNPAYREDTVRLNFLGQHGVSGSGEICLLTFTALKEGEAQISVEEVLFYTDTQMEHSANVGRGEVSVGAFSLDLTLPTEIEAWREFTAQVSFTVAPGVAGGSIVISYDAEQLRFLGYENPSEGFSVTVNESYAVGKIKISFAGTQGVCEGTLLGLCFVSKENPTEGFSTEIGFDEAPMLYTQSGVKILPASSDAVFTVAYNEQPHEVGDSDYNGAVDTRDATLLLQYLSGASDSILVDSFADLNGDGTADEADMEYLMKLLAGWDPSQISQAS